MEGRSFPGLTFEWGDAPGEIVLPLTEMPDTEQLQDDLYAEAMRKAGRVLARRAHSEAELREKLGAQLNETVGDVVVARLRQLGLLDDEAFARRWVQERAPKRGKRALRAELERKGVAAETIAGVLEKVPDENEEARAQDLATRHLDKVAGKPLQRQAASILQMLVRRGFDYELAEAATQAVLPPDGWD